MSGLRTEDKSAQPSTDAAILQPGPAFPVEQTAQDTDRTTPTSGTAQHSTTHVQLSPETNQAYTKDGSDNTDSALKKLLQAKPSELVEQTANAAGDLCDPFECATTEPYTDWSQRSQEQRATQSAVMHFVDLELPTTSKDSQLCRFSRAGWESFKGSSKETPRTVALEHAIAKQNDKDRCNFASTENNRGHFLETPEGKERSNQKRHFKRESVPEKAEDPTTARISQRPWPPQDRKRKHYGERAQNSGSQSENFVHKSPGAFTSKAKKRRKALPLFPDEKLGSLSLAAKGQNIKESPKADGLNTDNEEGFQPESLLQKHAECEKPSGKRKCKTKHLEGQGTRKRSFPAPDDPFDTENTQEMVAVPRKVAKQAESTWCRDSLPAKPYQRKPYKQRRQPPPPPTRQPAVLRVARPRQPMPPEARSISVDKNAGETLLQRAARLGYEKVVLYCLENKVCDVNHRDNAGYCALHEACARGHLSIVRLLLKYGADVNFSALGGIRPIHDAVQNDHVETVRLLLSYGANPMLPTYSGKTILHLARSKLMETFLTKYLMDLQGRSADDPELYWDFYGSSVCDPKHESGFDVLANPPGPDEEDEDGFSDVFEIEFSDEPLLPCYNIQVCLSQKPRNWLLLSDVVKRLNMSPHVFRSNFPNVEVVTITETEFYRQASLSQLLSRTTDLEEFNPESKELLEMVELTRELQTLLGSSLHYVHLREDLPLDTLP